MSFLFLAGCSDEQVDALNLKPKPFLIEEPMFESYKDSFYSESDYYFTPSDGLRGLDVVVGWDDLGFNSITGVGTAGRCVVYRLSGGSYYKEIGIDRDFWQFSASVQNSETVREMVINHELGHCVLSRMKHNCARGNFGEYYSILYPNLFSASIYTLNKKNLMDELFIRSDEFPSDRVLQNSESKSTIYPYEQCEGEEGNLEVGEVVSRATEEEIEGADVVYSSEVVCQKDFLGGVSCGHKKDR